MVLSLDGLGAGLLPLLNAVVALAWRHPVELQPVSSTAGSYPWRASEFSWLSTSHLYCRPVYVAGSVFWVQA